MIKCDGASIEFEGQSIDVLAELGLISEIIAKQLLENDIPEDFIRNVILLAVETGIKLAVGKINDLSEEEKRALEVQEIIRRLVGK